MSVRADYQTTLPVLSERASPGKPELKHAVFSSEAPRSESSDLSTYPGGTTEPREAKKIITGV